MICMKVRCFHGVLEATDACEEAEHHHCELRWMDEEVH
jgi:hypothetical protein